MLPKLATFRGRWFFQPLTMGLCFLMLPHLPGLRVVSGVPAAMAQADTGCAATQNRIIQEICTPGAPTAALCSSKTKV